LWEEFPAIEKGVMRMNFLRLIALLVVLLSAQVCFADVDLTGNWTGGFNGKATITKDGETWHMEADWGPDNHYIVEALLSGNTLSGSWHGSAGKTGQDPKGNKRHKWVATLSADGNTITPEATTEDAGRSHWSWGTLKRAK
jgi:hypothetical protein